MGTNPTNLLQTFFLIFLTLTQFMNYQTATAAVTAAATALFEIPSPSSCNGSIAECNEELEKMMESEISRSFLDEEKREISYRALRKDQPVCNGAPGQAYSAGECVPRSSNPYHRGCSPTYGCRGSA